MNDQDLREIVLATLCRIAPEVVPADLEAGRALRDQVDLDSMDWLNFLVALHDRLGVDIPETDYRRLATLDDLLGYLAARRAGDPAPPKC